MTTFGKMPDGTPVERVTISGGGLTAHVLTYGSVVQDLRLEGHSKPLVLGFETFAPYLTHSPYFGATAGRCANRIRDGHVELNGVAYQLDCNFLGKHSLHGGAISMGKRVWSVEHLASDSVMLSIRLEDGEMGYPGNLTAHVTYSLLPDGVFDVKMSATTDATTLCNMAHHSYFNLGEDNISDHLLQVEADQYLPVDEELIPTGEIASVAGTRFDFRQPNPVSQARLVDHNFCCASQKCSLRRIATLSSAAGGVTMEVHSTEPGLQVYDGAKINIDLAGLSGQEMRAHSGIALEPQIWPDANHHKTFPQAVLTPDETYQQHTQYRFSKG
jgi:aldose 1-epimerase